MPATSPAQEAAMTVVAQVVREGWVGAAKEEVALGAEATAAAEVGAVEMTVERYNREGAAVEATAAGVMAVVLTAKGFVEDQLVEQVEVERRRWALIDLAALPLEQQRQH